MDDQLRKPVTPLYMPSGSVRALVALTVVGVVLAETIRNREISLLLTETLLIVMAHYFASRRLINLPPETLERLADEGVVTREAHPLWLPRHSVRVLIILSFVGIGVFLFRETGGLTTEAAGNLGVAFAYLLGVIIAWLVRAVAGRREAEPGPLMRLWLHGKAIIVLLAAAGLVCVTLVDDFADAPQWVSKTMFALVLFYFGSR